MSDLIVAKETEISFRMTSLEHVCVRSIAIVKASYVGAFFFLPYMASRCLFLQLGAVVKQIGSNYLVDARRRPCRTYSTDTLDRDTFALLLQTVWNVFRRFTPAQPHVLRLRELKSSVESNYAH